MTIVDPPSPEGYGGTSLGFLIGKRKKLNREWTLMDANEDGLGEWEKCRVIGEQWKRLEGLKVEGLKVGREDFLTADYADEEWGDLDAGEEGGLWEPVGSDGLGAPTCRQRREV